MGLYRAVVRRLGGTPWARRIAPPVLQRVDTAMLHRGWHVTPFPTLLLTTTGRHTGDPHESPLWFIRAGEDFVVIATNYGRREPDWSRNLRAHPECRLTVGKSTRGAVAEQAAGSDWSELIGRFADFYPPYLDYLEHAHRYVPVWRLRPS